MTKYLFFLSGMLLLSIPIHPFPETYYSIDPAHNSPDPIYQIAFANFGPLNNDIFIADADGLNARPLLPNPANDYNASFSHDAKWVVFTSERNGSADIYRVHADGSGLEQLSNDPSFDDQAVFSPDGKKLIWSSNRNNGGTHDTNLFVADWE